MPELIIICLSTDSSKYIQSRLMRCCFALAFPKRIYLSSTGQGLTEIHFFLFEVILRKILLYLSTAEEFRDRKFSMVNLRKVSESHKTLDRRQSLQQSAFHNILQATKRVMSPPPESVKVK